MMYYVVLIAVLFLIELVYFRIADKYNIIDKPNERSSHQAITLRGGGVIFYFGAIAFFLICGFEYPWFFLGLTLISTISFIDDVRSIPDRYRLVVQFISMFLMFFELGVLGLSWWWSIIALIVCTGILNAFNFMDGINGITGGYSVVVLLLLYYVNTYVVSFTNEKLILSVLAAVLVFCFFNFRQKARCFCGDIGSISIAFIIVFLLGQLAVVTKNLGWIAFLVVYGVDTVLTIVHRIKLHENLGVAHRKHMFQIMANELKMKHLTVSALYMFVQLIVGGIYILYPSYLTLLIISLVLGLIYIFFMYKYYHLHEETLKKITNR